MEWTEADIVGFLWLCIVGVPCAQCKVAFRFGVGKEQDIVTLVDELCRGNECTSCIIVMRAV